MCNHESIQKTSYGVICNQCWSHYPVFIDNKALDNDRLEHLRLAVTKNRTSIRRLAIDYRSKAHPRGLSDTWLREVAKNPALSKEVSAYIDKYIKDAGITQLFAKRVA